MIELKDKKVKIYNDDYDQNLLKLYLENDTFNYDLKLEVGSVVEGTLMGHNNTHILVDIGYKDTVMIDAKKDEFVALERMGMASGDTVQVMITNVEEDPYLIVGSFIQLERKDAYLEILEHCDTRIFVAKVQEWSPAGFKLDISYDDHKIPSFMPNTLAGINKLSPEQSQDLIGKNIEVMIESFSDDKGTFIASRKKYLQTLIPTALENLKLKEDDGTPILHIGTVTGTTKSSVFVEFNECLTGMIHISNIESSLASSIESSFKPGNSIKFYVKEVIRGKLFLTQVWRVTIWDNVNRDDIFNDVVIKDIKKFGALVQLDTETVGLINNFELEKSKKTLRAGDKVNVKITNIQRMERKLGLSIV